METIVMEALGEEGFAALTAAFYRRVRTDEVIGPMYPEDDWEGSEKRLRDFLVFRFGGSDRYLIQRGHPRLRMRHVPFRIGVIERDRWLALMDAAMDEIELDGAARAHLTTFLAQVADFLRNQPDDPTA
ncbi:MAG: globin [Verrucomicrobiaceae bacterium]|nr:globin [Verrucomicrobiaceae bacterium]